MKSYCSFLLLLFFQFSFAQQASVDANRLEASFNKLKSFGYDASTKENTRIAFSDENIAALNYLENKLKGLDLRVTEMPQET